MTDEDGHEMIPPGHKMYSAFKVAGQKDDKFTVHLLNTQDSGEPNVVGTFRVLPTLRSEMIATDQATDEGAAGASLAVNLIGAFGLEFSDKPVKAGDTWNPPFDAKAIGAAFIEGTTHSTTAKVDSEGSVTITLQKLDEKSGTFLSTMHVKFSSDLQEGGQTHHVTFTMDCDQTTVIERTSCIPISIDRKIKMLMKADAETQATSLIMHLVRV